MPADTWLDLFYLCHEWTWDGQMQKGNKVKWMGHYTRLEWPSPGGALNQYQLVIDAFQIIRNEEAKMFASRL